MPDSDRHGAQVLDSIAHPQGVNLLGIYGGASQAAEGIWRNRLFQAQQAAGEAAQQATDPAGNFDPMRAQAISARNPAAALNYTAAATAGQELGNKQLGLNGQQMSTVARSVSSVLALPDDQQTPENYRAALDAALSQGAITKAHHDAGVANLPTGGGAAAMRNYGTRLLIGTLAGPDVATAVLPKWQMPNTGQEFQPQIVQPPTAGGAVSNAPGATTITLSPEAANQIVPVPYPQFLEDGKTPNPNWGRTFPMRHGDMVKLLPTAPPAQGGEKPASLRNPNKQRAAPDGAPQPAPAASPAPATTPGFGTGPSAADIEQQRVEAEQGTRGFQSISDQSVASRPRSAILGNMLVDTTKFATGAKAETIETLRNYANRLGIKVNTEGLSAQESFNKLAAQLANAQGAGSDARLNVNVAANPHQELSPQGVDLMVRQLQGNEDYLQARAKLAAAYGDQKNVKKFENEVGAKLDPRAFQVSRMTEQQRQAYDKGLSPEDRKQVKAAYNYAHHAGVF